jgi:outer membrane lipoprotein-sorting protein
VVGLGRLLPLLALLVAAVPGVPPARAADDALDAWLGRASGLRTWSATFRQTRTLAVLKDPVVAAGRVWFSEPGLFRWELGDPVQTLALRGTNEVVVVYPRLKRAERHLLDGLERGPMRDALALLDAGFPRSRAGLEERFVIRSIDAVGGGVHRLALEPRSRDARRLMTGLWIDFVPTEPGPRATELRFADGTLLRNEFSGVVVNPDLEAGWFNPAIPEGYKVAGPR